MAIGAFYESPFGDLNCILWKGGVGGGVGESCVETIKM